MGSHSSLGGTPRFGGGSSRRLPKGFGSILRNSDIDTPSELRADNRNEQIEDHAPARRIGKQLSHQGFVRLGLLQEMAALVEHVGPAPHALHRERDRVVAPAM